MDFAVFLYQVNQYQHQGAKKAEGAGNAVPCFRHPHAEPFAAYRHEANLPGQEAQRQAGYGRSEEHTSELQSLMRISYAVFCLKKKKSKNNIQRTNVIRS